MNDPLSRLEFEPILTPSEIIPDNSFPSLLSRHIVINGLPPDIDEITLQHAEEGVEHINEWLNTQLEMRAKVDLMPNHAFTKKERWESFKPIQTESITGTIYRLVIRPDFDPNSVGTGCFVYLSMNGTDNPIIDGSTAYIKLEGIEKITDLHMPNSQQRRPGTDELFNSLVDAEYKLTPANSSTPVRILNLVNNLLRVTDSQNIDTAIDKLNQQKLDEKSNSQDTFDNLQQLREESFTADFNTCSTVDFNDYSIGEHTGVIFSGYFLQLETNDVLGLHVVLNPTSLSTNQQDFLTLNDDVLIKVTLDEFESMVKSQHSI